MRLLHSLRMRFFFWLDPVGYRDNWRLIACRVGGNAKDKRGGDWRLCIGPLVIQIGINGLKGRTGHNDE